MRQESTLSFILESEENDHTFYRKCQCSDYILDSQQHKPSMSDSPPTNMY
jgi:hypothetical protein